MSIHTYNINYFAFTMTIISIFLKSLSIFVFFKMEYMYILSILIF